MPWLGIVRVDLSRGVVRGQLSEWELPLIQQHSFCRTVRAVHCRARAGDCSFPTAAEYLENEGVNCAACVLPTFILYMDNQSNRDPIDPAHSNRGHFYLPYRISFSYTFLWKVRLQLFTQSVLPSSCLPLQPYIHAISLIKRHKE